jgi:hypothetical protein
MMPKGILPDFQEFLLSNKLAPEKNVLFLAIWVSKFLAFSNRKGHADIGLGIMVFDGTADYPHSQSYSKKVVAEEDRTGGGTSPFGRS